MNLEILNELRRCRRSLRRYFKNNKKCVIIGEGVVLAFDLGFDGDRDIKLEQVKSWAEENGFIKRRIGNNVYENKLGIELRMSMGVEEDMKELCVIVSLNHFDEESHLSSEDKFKYRY